MKKEEILDKYLEQLKQDYSESKGPRYIPLFVKNLCGEDKVVERYIKEQLEGNSIVTPQNNPDGTKYWWSVMLNAKGLDWMEEYGNWSGYVEAKDAPKKHGLRVTKHRVQILNRLFLFKHFNKQNYYDSLKELIHPNQTEDYEHFLCAELDWVSSTKIDGKLMIAEIDRKEAPIFIEKGMFNYLLEKEADSQVVESLGAAMIINNYGSIQNLHVSIIQKAIIENLTIEQIAEVKEIIATAKNDEDRKGKVKKWFKSLGKGVTENILADMITKPELWSNITEGVKAML